MRKEQLRDYKSNYDQGVTTQRVLNQKSEAEIARLKRKRADYTAKQRELINKRLEAREGTRNYGLLSKKQQRIKERQIERAQQVSKRLKYQQNGGDIAFRNIMDEGNWVDNFVSSNVGKFRARGENLLVAFLNGSVYMYFGVAKMFLGILNAGSKGKGVGNRLRRPQVGYMKIR